MTTETQPQSTNKPAPTRHRFWTPLHIIEALIILGLLAWQFGAFKKTPTVAIITSGEGPYWDRVEAGAQKAAEQYDVKVTMIRVKSDMQAQIDAIKAAVDQDLDGVAISPINPVGEAAALADIAGSSTLVTLDSDSQIARRLCFVGTDNYDAGRMCGQLVHDAIPDGGEVIISVGNADKQNTDRRRQGLIDALLDRPFEPDRASDGLDEPIKGEKYTVVATLVDNADHQLAADLAAKALADHPNVKCFVGLLSYSAPAIAKGLEQAGKPGMAKIVGFDVDEQTLAGIESGQINSTIMQDQFGCGFHAVRILGENARGDRSQLPVFDQQVLPTNIVNKENVAAVRQRLALAGTATPS